MNQPLQNETAGDFVRRMIARDRARDHSLGLEVRCPVCNHGIGKFCLVEGVTHHTTAADIAFHPERKAAQDAAGL
jgi:hypothetical protein